MYSVYLYILWTYGNARAVLSCSCMPVCKRHATDLLLQHCLFTYYSACSRLWNVVILLHFSYIQTQTWSLYYVVSSPQDLFFTFFALRRAYSCKYYRNGRKLIFQAFIVSCYWLKGMVEVVTTVHQFLRSTNSNRLLIFFFFSILLRIDVKNVICSCNIYDGYLAEF